MKTILLKFLSRKLLLSLLGIGIILGLHGWNLKEIHSLRDPNQIAAFTQLTTHIIVAVVAIVAGFCGINGLISWKHGSTTQTILDAVNSRTDEQIIQKFEERYAGQPDYAPRGWVEDAERYS